MDNRKELIARLRDYTYESDPRHLMEAAATMLEADAQPQYGWLTACDEEMIVANIGVAELSDSYEIARRKLGELIAWHVAVATDPAVNGGLSLQPAVPQEPVKTKEQATAFIESPLWEAIDMHGAFPNALIDSRTWEHLSCYAPLPKPQPQRPRLTDDEIAVIGNHYTDVTCSMTWDVWPTFARAIEKKVRGEA